MAVMQIAGDGDADDGDGGGEDGRSIVWTELRGGAPLD
jgi:hypothetical protein